MQGSVMNRKLLIGIAGVLLLACCFAGLAIYIVTKRGAPRTADQFYARGAMRFNRKDYLNAYQLFTIAVQKNPTNVIYCREAARAAALRGRSAEAQLYAQKAWEHGLKDAELWKFIVASYSPVEKTNALAVGLKLLEELPQSEERAELHGDILYHFNEPADAFRAWQTALSSYPTNVPLLIKLAKLYVQRKETDQAKKLLEQYQVRGTLSEEGFSILAFIYVAEENYKRAIEIFEQARQQGQYRPRLTLENALVHLINQRLDEARAVLEESPHFQQWGSSPLDAQIRIFLGYTLWAKNDRKAIHELLKLVSDKLPPGPRKECEQVYLEALLQILDEKSEALSSLTKARRLLPGQPAIELLYAQQNINRKNFSEAIESLNQIKGVLERWPPVAFELAVALHGNRQEQQALRVLSRLHRRKMISKQSLELFRDIAFQNNDVKASQAAQNFLEKAFPDDAGVQLFKGIAALQQGSFSEAGVIFQEMAKKYPEDARAQVGPIQVLVAEGKAQTALQACQTSSAPAELLAPLEAFAHLKLRQWTEAEAAFQKAITVDQPSLVYAEYGKLLLRQKKLPEAARQFQTALSKSAGQVEAYVGLALLAAEDKQWDEARKHALSALTLNADQPICYFVLALADASAGDLSKALGHCERALRTDPNLIRASLLQATLRGLRGQNDPVENDKAEKEFVQLLRKLPADDFVKRQLAVVYRRKGQYRKALDLIDQIASTQPTARNLQLFRLELLALAGRSGEADALLSTLKPSLSASQYAMAAAFVVDAEGVVDKALRLLEPFLLDRAAAIQWASIHVKHKREPASWRPLLKHSLSTNDWAQIAEASQAQELWSASAFCWEQALRILPNEPAFLNNWAWSAMNVAQFDKEKVLDACERAYSALPRDSRVLDTFAEGLLRSGRSRACTDLLVANLSLTQRTPQLLWLLARAYEAEKDIENSLRTYRKVLDLQKQSNDWELRVGKEALNQQIQKLESKVN
jgi:predicted Zn-dependent protease